MRPSRPWRQIAESRRAFLVLILALLFVLVAGSIHAVAPSESARIANLENVLKCPSCADASLAQSETVGANAIKATITRWVYTGLTDRQIEDRMVATYGEGELLRPTNRAIWIIPLVVVVVAATALVGTLMRRRGGGPFRPDDEDERVLELLRARKDQGPGPDG